MNKIYQKIKEKIKENNVLYVISVIIRNQCYYFFNKISNYQVEKIKFFRKLGYPLNLKNPQSYNEKIIWKKIYDRNHLLPITADKCQVRTYLKEVLGEKRAKNVLIPLLFVTDQPETIPFERFPPSFIVEPNHASGLQIMVENGTYNKEKIIKTCKRWLKTPYGLEKLEWAYQFIERKIVVEKLLRDDERNIPSDFRFNIFNGKCKSVHAIFRNDHSISSFDEKWNFLSIKILNCKIGPKIKKPKNFEIMLKLAEKLSKPFDYVRVDLYNLKGKIFFGELTHYPASGINKFEPQSFDFKLGNYWKIEPKYWEKKRKNII